MNAEAMAERAPFSTAGPRAESTTQQIKNYILLNRLRPGDLMPTEAELCSSLGVSRSSVREAIRTLAALDIIEVRHGYGTFVGNLTLAPLIEGLVFRGVLSPDDDLAALREIVEVRAALDHAMAENLIAGVKGTSNPDLEHLVDEMELRSSQNRSFAEVDLAFHAGLASRLENKLVQQLIIAFWEIQTAVYPKLGLAPPAQLDETARAHRRMLCAAQEGDLAAYHAAVVAHYAPIERAISLAAEPAVTLSD